MSVPSRSGNPRFSSPTAIIEDARTPAARIVDRARRLAALKDALWPLLPVELQARCDLANYRRSTLILTAQSPAWALRLRQLSPRIIHTLNRDFKIPCTSVAVRVEPGAGPRTAPQARRGLTPTARRALLRAARLCEDEELARRIASLPDAPAGER